MSNTKELAKELCEKSGCHHKCNDTSDCVVEDEAKEVIANSATTTEKQIEEMAKIIHGFCEAKCPDGGCDGCVEYMDAETLYNAGYRKQSEGEWVRQKGSPEAICSNCGRDVVYQVIDNKWAFENYCPHCGARMSGGKICCLHRKERR